MKGVVAGWEKMRKRKMAGGREKKQEEEERETVKGEERERERGMRERQRNSTRQWRGVWDSPWEVSVASDTSLCPSQASKMTDVPLPQTF